MFDLERAIHRWLRSFRRHRAFNHGAIREMELHLRDHIDDLLSKGLGVQEAFDKAVREFGDIKPMAREEYWNIRRKRTFINTIMLNSYFKIAFRNLWRHKFYAFINIIGLTIGLSIVFMIALFVNDELSFDQFHKKKERLYRVVENQYYAGQPVFPVAVTPTALGPSLMEEYPEIVNFTRVYNDNFRFELGEKKISENSGIVADASFFEMFTFPLVSGTVQSFKTDLNALILTEELADKYFPDEEATGKSINLDGEQFFVRAVMADPPKNSHLPFRYITNFERYLSGDPDRANSWGSNWLYTYVEMAPAVDLNTVNDKIIGQIKANNEGSVTDIYLQPLTDIYLGEVDFTVEARRKGEMMYVKIFSIVAIFILIISCINFMNLSTARSAKRAKEVGLRKTVGANRRQLVFQFLSESVLLSVTAVILSIGVVALLLPFFNQIANKEFDLRTFLEAGTGFKLGLGILLTAVLTGLFSGSYPALFLSSIEPVRTLGTHGTALRQGAGLRKILVILQFTISVVLIIGTMVVYQQFRFIQDVNLGYNKNNIIYTFVPGEKSEVFSNEIRNQRGVINVGLSNRHPAYVLSSTSGFDWPGKNPDETILMHYMSVDEHYMPTMEMNVIDGRQFVHTDTSVVIINERAKEIMGLEDPVGQSLSGRNDYRIVGVVSDFNFKSIHTAIEPIVIFKSDELSRVYIRYDPMEQAEISERIESVWMDFFPDREFNIYYLDEDFNDMYDAEMRTSKLSTYFAGLAIIISCLGLFGLVSYATEQRTKEIGIRKVLGASISNLFLLLTYDFTRLVLIALVIAIPVGWYAMNQWLDSYAYRIDISVWVFILSAITAVLIAVATVSYQSVRASISNPVRALRNE